MKLENAGWIAAGVLAMIMVGSGFQGTTSKTGTIDLARVLKESALVLKQQEDYQAKRELRAGIIDFLNTYRTASADQMKQFRDLSLLPVTPAIKDQIDKLKKDIQASDAQLREFATKTNPSAQEVAQMKDLNDRTNATLGTLPRWAKEFDDELQTVDESFRKERVEKLKKAVKDVGAKKGFTVIFTSDVVPYSANDLTSDALKAMNSLK